MKKSLIALLLVVALVVTVSVFAASAETTNPFEGKTGKVTAYCEHCKTEVEWSAAPKTQNSNLVVADKHVHYYLQGNTTSGSRTISKDGANICVNLNGFTWTRTSTTAAWQCVEGGEFNIMDTSVGKTGVLDAKHTANQPVIKITAGTFNLYGGKLTRSVANSASTAGASANGGAVVMTGGTFNMYGGSIDTYTKWAGGAIHMKKANFNFYGGTITGVSDGEAGGISIGENANVLVDGGTFDGCISKAALDNTVGGAAMKLASPSATLTMKSGTIKNCTATSNGGAVCNPNATFTMEGGTIENCTATRGGAVFISGSASKILMSGGTIKNCTATEAGGALYIQYQSKGSEISGEALIDNCSAPNGGGIALGGSGVPAITVKGGTIQNCYTTQASGAFGGSIYDVTSEGAIVTIEGGTISGGKADDGNGGNIYMTKAASQLKITGGEITKGTALRVNGKSNGNAGNIYVNGGTFTMEGGTISGGLETNNAAHCGNLYLAGGVVANITGGTITGGKCANYGGNLYVYGAQLTIDAAEGKTVTITNGKGAAGGNLYIREADGHTSASAAITGPDVTISGGNATNSNGTGTTPTRAQCGSQIMLYGTAKNTCTLTLTDVAIDSTEIHTDEIALYEYAELKVGGTKNIDCAYIADANSKVVVLPGYTGEMHVRWFDTAIGAAVVPGATVNASLTYEEGYADTGVIKACNASRSGKIASTNGKGGFFIAGFGGFNYNAETKKYEETPLATMPTGEDAFDFVRSYLNDGSTIELAANTTLDLNNGVFAIKTNGFQLNLVENRSNEFDYEKGYITVDDETKVNIKTQLANGNQYLVLADKAEGEATKFTAHRVKVDIDSVNIKPATAGLYYTTNMDTTLEASQAAVSYGVVLSLVDMPDAGFIADDSNADSLVDNLYTEIDFEKNEEERMSIQGANSALLVGILNQGAPEGQNDAWGSKPIYANAFVCFNIDGKNVYFMADKTYTLSLKDIMELVDGNEDLASHASVVKMYNTWQDPMAQWKLPNIAAAANA